jgi:hypothetical protein
MKNFFWKLTLKATRKGKLKNLEVIPRVHIAELLETYYLPLVQEIRVRLKHIVIDSNLMTTSWNSGDIPNTFCDVLPKIDFPKLEGIDFVWTDDISLMNSETIINCYSKYKSFKTLSLGMINLDINRGIYYDNCCRLISNLLATDIKILRLWTVTFCDINMLYLMRKFPKLERLSFFANFSVPRESITPSNIAMEQVIIRFFEFVLQVPKLENIDVIIDNNNTTKSYRFLLAPLLKRNDTEEWEENCSNFVIIRNKKV